MSRQDEYESKEFEAVMMVAEELYGDLDASTWASIWECWMGRETDLDMQIVAANGIRTLEIGRVLYERGFYDANST